MRPPPPDGAPGGETRALARLPGLDIAILHEPAQGGAGERVTVTIQTMPLPSGPALAGDPFALWLQMAQAAWAPWLAMTGTLWALPRIMGGR